MNAYSLFVDPGRRTGWAVFEDRFLHGVGTGVVPHLYIDAQGRRRSSGDTSTRPAYCMYAPYSLAYVELPHAGPGRASKRDIIVLARRAQQCLDEIRADKKAGIEAPRWKGQVPKRVMAARVRDLLQVQEWLLLPNRLQIGSVPATCDELDAIGLGLWAHGRL
jgi:hypothetical protein